MFTLYTIEDSILIHPQNFGQELDAVKTQISGKYLNRVIKDVGLCVGIFDVLSMGDAFIHPNEGSARVLVQFRTLVFRPFVGEIIKGKIKNSNEEGIQVSVGFFEDIFITPNLLKQPSYFNEEEQIWYWKYGEHELFLEQDSEIRFRIESIIFHERISQRPEKDEQQLSHEEPTVPMIILAAVNEDGLGCIQWWDQSKNINEDESHKNTENFMV